jgi:hypothetical protein
VLEDFAGQDLRSMDDEQLADYLKSVKEQIGSLENVYLTNILATLQ